MKHTFFTRIALSLIIVILAGLSLPTAAFSQSGGTQLIVSPASSTATTCADQTIAIRVQDVTDLYAYSIQLSFTPGSLNILEVSNGGFLAAPGEPALFEPTNGFNNTTGTISFGMTQMSPALPKDGSGDLILIRLQAMVPGQTVNFTINTSTSALVNWPDVLPITYTATNGTVTTASCAPTDIILSNNTVAENLPAGTTVGTLSTTDPDPADTSFNYTFADTPTYPDNASFSIAGNTLNTAAIFNYEGKNSYTIQIRTTDPHGLAYTEVFTITITDVNDAPILAAIGNQSINELAALTFTATATDADLPAQPLTFSLVGAPGGATITSDGDFSWTPTEAQGPGPYTFTVQVCDNASPTPACDTEDITVTVAEVNISPIADDRNLGTPVNAPLNGLLTANDADIPAQPFTFTILTDPAHGTVNITDPATGAFTYTPGTDYEGSDSFTFTVDDNNGGTDTGTINITVSNDAPVSADQTVTANEDSPVNITLVANDPNGSALTWYVGTPSHGTLSGTAPNLIYTPTSDYHGPDSFTFYVNDGTMDSNTATVTITVNSVPDVPVASDQTVSTSEDTPLNIILAGSDGDNDPLTWYVSVPAHGSLSGTAPNLIYTPDEDYNGPDSFTFYVNDGTSDSNTATVSITVTAVNDAPVLDPITTPVAGDEGTPIAFDADATDADLPGQTLTFSLIGTVPPGATIDPVTGEFSWTPGEDQGPGSYTITVQVCDDTTPTPACDTQDVIINVGETNTAPVLDPITTPIAGDEGTPIAFDADATDTDLPGQTLTLSLVGTVPPGATIDPVTGEFSWTPTEAQGPGSYTITVQACDDTTPTPACDTQDVIINVGETNVAPVLNPITTPVAGDEGTPIAFDADATDADLPGQTLTFSLIGTVPPGATIDPVTGEFSWTPTEGQGPGSYTFTVQVCDDTTPAPACDTQDVIINVGEVNVAPVLDPITTPIAGDEGTSIAFDADATDADLPGQTLTFSLISTVPPGATIDPVTGEFSWTPSEDQGPGSFTITVQVCDDTTPTPACDTQDVIINVGETNVAPVLNPITTPVAGDEGTPIAFDADATDADLPGQTLTFSLIGTVPPGATIDPVTGEFSWTPSEGQGPGSYTFTVQVCDDTTPTPACDTQDVIINVGEVNIAPVADDQAVSTPEETALGILLTATDADGNPLTWMVGTPAHGTLSGTAPSLTYTPNLDYTGPDSFTFTVNDGTVDSNTATISITVTPINDAPTADDETLSTPEDTALAVTLTASDPDSDPLTWTILTNPAHGTLSGTAPSLTYTPNLDYTGPDSFTFTVNDGTVDSNTAMVSITVTPVNDAPTADDQTLSTPEDTALAVTLTATDPDGDPLTWTVGTPAHGTLTGTAPSLTYTPDADYTGPDSFTFTVNDGTVDSNTATISITVTPINDAPTADDQTLTTPEDTALAITLTATDPDGDPLTWTVGTPAHGTLTGTAPSLTYTPVVDYTGPDNFTFTVNDGTVDSNTATVSITVTPVNDAPVAVEDAYTMDEDTTLTIVAPGVLANDTDVDDTVLTTDLVTDVAHGSLALAADGSFVYTPALDYFGTDTFTYRAYDGEAYSNMVTVTITINDVPDNVPPVALDDAYDMDEDTVLTIPTLGVLANDSDADGDELTAELLSDVTTGVLLLNADGSFTYTPDADFFGVVTFTYRAFDGVLYSAPATVTITVNDVSDIKSIYLPIVRTILIKRIWLPVIIK